MAILFATLNACAPVSKSIEPIVVEKIKTVSTCPSEVTGEIAPLPKIPDGARIEGNEKGQEWLSALYEYAFGIRAKMQDAKDWCLKL